MEEVLINMVFHKSAESHSIDISRGRRKRRRRRRMSCRMRRIFCHHWKFD